MSQQVHSQCKLTFGHRLAQLRKQKGYTQQDMSDMLKIRRGSYAHYEIDKREPNFASLCKLSDIFEVTTDFLLGRDFDISLTIAPEPSHRDVVSGKMLPSLRTAQRIAKALGTTVDDLWPLEDD